MCLNPISPVYFRQICFTLVTDILILGELIILKRLTGVLAFLSIPYFIITLNIRIVAKTISTKRNNFAFFIA